MLFCPRPVKCIHSDDLKKTVMNKTGYYIFFLLLSNFVLAQEKPLVLDGTIGKYHVVMEISVYDSSCEARYFYATQRKDIKLTGTIDRNNEILVTSDNRGDKNTPVEKLELKKVTNVYTGTWSSGNKKFPVTLKRVSSDIYKN